MLAAVKELDFAPNHLARGLRRQRRMQIGVDPPLTTMGVPVNDIAELLMTRFRDQVESGGTPTSGTLVETVLTVGGTA